MRVHHLEVTAFGPFCETQRVELDDLSAAGLFLLCGPTGAGKTSVLDAICFGLYGEVPGDRNSAKRLRSDHAPADVAPAVRLEVSIAGRRFRLHRSPAWARPKRRGTGTTTEHAKVTLEELTDGEWRHLSSRLDEAGQLVTDLLGMNPSQFTQVAMLPQGRFQAFLRAKSDERHKLLQRLFRTDRFEDIEKWLVAHRVSLKNANQAHHDAVSSVLNRLSEAAAVELPESWDARDLTDRAENGDLTDWADQLITAATEDHGDLAAATTTAKRHAAVAREQLEQVRTLAEHQARHARAVQEQAELCADEEHAQESRQRVEAARRAAPVLPLLAVADEAEQQLRSAERAVADALSGAARLLEAEASSLHADHLAAAETSAREVLADAKALLPREAELARAHDRLERVGARSRELGRHRSELTERCERIPGELAALRAQQAEAADTAAGLAAARDKHAGVGDRLEAAAKVATLRAELDAAQELLRSRVDHAQDLREQMHQIREARINGMAAELAASLTAGECCPVCGSAEHPARATPAAAGTSQKDEETARSAYEDADFVRQSQAEAVATLERNLAVASAAAGGKDVETLTNELDAASADIARCREAERARERTAAAVREREDALEAGRQELQSVQAELARLDEQETHALATIETVSKELATLLVALGGEGDLADLIAAKSTARDTFARARGALEDSERATGHRDRAWQHVRRCADEHGFSSPEEATGCALTERELDALTQALRRRDEARARVEAVLADPAVAAASTMDAPDLEAAQERAKRADEAMAESGAAARMAQARLGRLTALATELRDALAAWQPTRSAYAVARSVSTFAEGKGADNTLQMRLSAYVLASRLRQVVAAANERLRTMSDRRYSLEHSAARGVGELRGGLSLSVRDEWTGESRDPATLSGGETFVASLALALGLADVVTQEAGGTGIDTLFIDEGFGSLDPDTLDDVMDTLDTLRDGGRVVGIVSHVPEMRTRVPAQLRIHKDRSGSHVLAARESS